MSSDPETSSAMAQPDDVQERVLKVIATTKRLPRESVSADSTFEALGIDSLDRLNILFDLESEFDIQINDEDAKKVENIHQMVAGVQHLVDAQASGSPAGVVVAGEPVRRDSVGEGDTASGAYVEAGASRDPASSAR